MATISSSTLFHMTRKFTNLKKIINTGLRFSYSYELTDKSTSIIQGYGYFHGFTDEKLNNDSCNAMTGVAIPMICFCDTPLLRIKEHCVRYGNFAIGLDKEIMSEYYNNLINPVWYTESKNVLDLLKHYAKINYQTQKQFHTDLMSLYNTEKQQLEHRAQEVGIYGQYMVDTKLSANYLLGYNKPRKDYYNEREWRAILPDDEDIAPWLWDIEKQKFDLKVSSWNDSMNGNEHGFLDFSSDSDYIDDAITHIIVDTNKRIPAMIKFVMETKQIFGAKDISYEQRLLLVSKITSFERINQDF